MRRLAIALATGGIVVLGVAAPAQADPGLNYGHCVSSGLVEPSAGTIGPAKINPNGKFTGAYNAYMASHYKSHFDDWGLCPKG
ncbi:hypothetical protein [Micromonospora sp. NPDC005173]|uniref:hypothetical protein n=1 Tax=Micromonospora sp. NPDC005173 TaxID=3157165 RepID=UPI0033BE8590